MRLYAQQEQEAQDLYRMHSVRHLRVGSFSELENPYCPSIKSNVRRTAYKSSRKQQIPFHSMIMVFAIPNRHGPHHGFGETHSVKCVLAAIMVDAATVLNAVTIDISIAEPLG